MKNNKTSKYFIPYISHFWATYQKARQSSKKSVEVRVLHVKPQISKSYPPTGQIEIQPDTPAEKSIEKIRKRCQFQIRQEIFQYW